MSLALITPVNDNFRRDLEVADTTLLDPTETDALEQGEWMVPNAAGALVRVGATTVANAHQLFTPRGDTSAQAIGKVTSLQLHEYEAETDMFDPAPTYTLGMLLAAHEVTIDTIARGALTEAAATDHVVGFVTRLPADNNGLLRFQRHSPYVLA